MSSEGDKREGSLEAPVRHPIEWQSPEYYEEGALFGELTRVFGRVQHTKLHPVPWRRQVGGVFGPQAQGLRALASEAGQRSRHRGH